MAKPDKMRKSQLFLLMLTISVWLLVKKTMSQAIRMTTTVRIAVARLDGTPSIPILAKIDVRAAKIADKSAKKNHMATSSLTIISKASALSAIR